MNLLDHIKSILEQNESFCKDGRLFKNSVVEAALKLDPELLKILLTDDKAKKYFFADVEGITVFDKVKFQKFVSNKEFLPDSFTAYKNKIGLTANGEYLTEANEVVLDFPYKDCVLEGGQTKEDQKRKEIFWNETLAPDEIDRLLEPKALTHWKRYDKDGEQTVDKVSTDDNLIIKGNNLLALHSLLPKYKGQVKLIYLDPPYNNKDDSFGYNDSFDHSTLLTFIQNRLSVCKKLLSKNGTIWISIDDNEAQYLKVLADSVFGREKFIATNIWQKRYSRENREAIGDVHEYIYVYAMNPKNFKETRNLVEITEQQKKVYRNPNNDPKGRWRPIPMTAQAGHATKDQFYEITGPTGKIFTPPEGRCWGVAEKTFKKLLKDGRIYFGKNGDAQPNTIRYLSEVEGVAPWTWWSYDEVGHTDESKKELYALFGRDVGFDTPKPERLMQRIIKIASNPNDLIVDCFVGSGTTCGVAHKMGRKYIGIEQMESQAKLMKGRIIKVIDGEQGGISEKVNWKGGGSFVYAELAQDNAGYIDIIYAAKKSKALIKIWDEIKNKGFISYKVTPRDIDDSISEFSKLSLDDQKKLLISLLDKNQLYVNYSDIDDVDHQISKEDKALNHQFYKS